MSDTNDDSDYFLSCAVLSVATDGLIYRDTDPFAVLTALLEQAATVACQIGLEREQAEDMWRDELDIYAEEHAEPVKGDTN